MPTNATGRMGSRSSSGTFSFFSGGSNARGSGKPNKGRRTGRGRTVAGTSSSAYKGCTRAFQNKIQSFKTLINQTTGQAKFTRPSPATLNSFANWINKGAVILTVSPAQVARWAKAARKNVNSRNVTPTTCKNVLCTKFGKNAIKAVARTKSGQFMVATAPVVNGKPFNFPK